MPPAHPLEFRRRAIELGRERAKPIALIAKDLGISEGYLRSWLHQAEVDEGHKPGLSTDERAELVRLRREKRVLEMEVEILKRAAAYFEWIEAFYTRTRRQSSSRCSARPSSNDFTPPRRSRHDRPNQPVRKTRGTSEGSPSASSRSSVGSALRV